MSEPSRGFLGLGPKRVQGRALAFLSTLCLLAVLIGLGVWQLHRLTWKQALLADIARAEQSDPVPLTVRPNPFSRVTASGWLRYDLAALYGADVRDTARGPVLGGQLLVPLARPGQPDLLVDLGWVADAARASRPVAEDAVITGYVRPPDRPGWFAATDDVAGRRFYTLDPRAIGAALGLSDVAPFTLVAMGPPPEAAHLPRPPNDHLSYAFTWFGLAGALLVIFSTWYWKASRS